MKSKILLISSLVGLSLIGQAVKASGNTSFEVKTNIELSNNKLETLSEKIQTLIKKDNIKTSASNLSLTINVLEDYQNNNTTFLSLSKEEKAVFNSTIKSIVSQSSQVDNANALNWIKEINKSAKNINTIWAISEKNPAVDVDLNEMTEAPASTIVVFN